MKLGIAISVYDKFEELAILVDIIKKNWKGKYIISVCCNHPNPDIEGLDIDVFTKGEDIKFDPKMIFLRKNLNMRCRIWDSIQKACAGAEKLGADYVLNLFAEAWPLKEEEVLKLVNELKEKDKALAVRGLGFGHYSHKSPMGHVDDMFFIYDVKKRKENKFLDFNPIALLSHKQSMHGIFSTLIVARIGLENTYLYDDHTKQEFWDGKRHPAILERGRPSMYDPKRGFLKMNAPTFPQNYGKSIQAMYLKENGITKGKYIQEFLRMYSIDKKQLIKDLDKMEKSLNRKLRLSGFPILSYGRFGRNFTKKQRYLDSKMSQKIKYCLSLNARSLWDVTIKKKFHVDLIPDYNFWPESIEGFLSRFVNETDYPDSNPFWFEKKKNLLKKEKAYYKSGFQKNYLEK